MDILEFILSNGFEMLYFPIMFLLIKEEKKHRILYVLFTMIIYIALMNIFPFNLNFQLLYWLGMYFLSILLYRKNSSIINLVVITIISILLILVTSILYFIFGIFYQNIFICMIVSRITLIIISYLLKDRLVVLYNKILKFWNVPKTKNKIGALTIRNIFTIIMNINFVLIGISLLFTS